MFIHCIAIIWIAFSHIITVCMPAILRRLDVTIETHAKMRHCAAKARARAKLPVKHFDHKVL